MRRLELCGVGKRFMLSHQRPTSLRERFVQRRVFGGKVSELWAVKGVDFNIGEGELFGILGANGSGKSTLLRLIAGVMEPTTGSIRVHGRVGALLDLAAGFHPELTGLENVELNGALLGMTPAEVTRKRDVIISFTGLESFIDTPVKYYSSGMLMRLGFSISIHLDPSILLVDEVLAVGDESFQRQCLDRIDVLRDQGKSIILVSHDMQQIRRLCGRAIWLHEGQIAASGRSEDVVMAYLEFAEKSNIQTEGPDHGGRWGSGEMIITGVELSGPDGIGEVFAAGEPWRLTIRYQANREIQDPVIGYAIHRSDGLHVTGPNTSTAGLALGTVAGAGTVEYSVESLSLLPGTYHLSTAIYDKHIRNPFDHLDRLIRFRVRKGGTTEREGVVTFNGTWRHTSG